MAADHILRGDATAPVARRHPAPALPRVLRAARLDHRRRGRPVNALLGSVNQLLWCVDRYEPRAVVCCFGQESATYRTELYPPYHAHRPPMPDAAGRPVGARAGALRGARLDGRPRTTTLEADDLMHAYAAAEVDGRRARADPHRRPRHVPVRGRRDHDPAPARAPGGPGRDGRRRGRGALRHPAARRAGLHRAARRPVRRAAGREGDRREDRGRAAAPPRQPRGGDRRRDPREARRSAARCSSRPTSCARSRTSRRCATPTSSARRTAPTDRAGGAEAARALGMGRLAARLEAPSAGRRQRRATRAARSCRAPRPSPRRARGRRGPAGRPACRPTSAPSRPRS